MKKKLIVNAYIPTLNNGSDKKMNVLIDNGKIKDILESGISNINSDVEVIDAKDMLLVPGFIDLHIQGAGGYDILDATEEAILTKAKCLANLGTTSFLSTTVVKPITDNKHIKVANRYINKAIDGANILGYHLEGPFINPIKKGGIDINSIYPSSSEKLSSIIDDCENNLKMMTIAPELPYNLEIITQLREKDIIASFAHSNASYAETISGISAGLNHVTHLFNAMNPLHHREPGPIAAIFEHRISSQIIADGHHINGRMVDFAHRNLGVDNCICITDGVQAMGLPEGKYHYNTKEYIAKDGAAKYLDGTLIGSTTPLGKIALKFMEYTNCSLAEAINTVSLNPARVLSSEHRKGKIELGYDADLVIMNSDFDIYKTLVGGRIIL